MCRFTSAIRKARGSAARTKTPTGYCGTTCRRKRICPAIRSQTWMRSLYASINGHERRWAFKLRRINFKPVLHRSLETTRLHGPWPRRSQIGEVSGSLSPMKYQVVVQWPANSMDNYDQTVEIENLLIQRLSPRNKIDGHDFGSGEANIFVHTDEPQKAFEEIKGILTG